MPSLGQFLGNIRRAENPFYAFLYRSAKWALAVRLPIRSEEHTSELQSQSNLVCRLLLEKKQNRHVAGKSIHILSFVSARRRRRQHLVFAIYGIPAGRHHTIRSRRGHICVALRQKLLAV